ncbi:MAG: hypothetical protein R3E01_07925 [Pirellulaceae bacterium]|nr:hypothetical protein [Planctomycetales bacterium]
MQVRRIDSVSCDATRATTALRSLISLAVVTLGFVSSTNAAETSSRQTTVGMPVTLEEVVIPGGELIVAPLEDPHAVAITRIIDVYPHGTAHRYTLQFYALEPGTYNVSDYLRNPDGSQRDELPAMQVEVTTLLEEGQVQPHALGSKRVRGLGGYRLLLIAGGVVWMLVFLALMFVRKRPSEEGGVSSTPLTLAQRLRPLVQRGIRGKLSTDEYAQLERVLIAYWRRRLGWNDLSAADAIMRLRQHPESSPLLLQMENWLHNPNRNGDVDVAALLKPYEQLPADDFDDAFAGMSR